MMKNICRVLKPLSVSVFLLLGACGRTYWLAKYDHDIRSAGRAVEAARNDAGRAGAYSERGRAYSEKARYSKSFKLISAEEYTRLFGLAISDHDRAVALAPAAAGVYLNRGLTFYDRAALEAVSSTERAAFFGSAMADFTSAIARDERTELAFDMRGLIYIQTGDYTRAINDFAREAKLDPHIGNMRLAEAYCGRASSYQMKKAYDLAIADYSKALVLGAPSDGCDCDPYAPLAWNYYQKKEYDKSWDIVLKAQSAKRWIPPEFLADLKKASGRDR